MGIPSWAKPGAKVECVRTRRFDPSHTPTVRHPVLGEELTIRSIDVDHEGVWLSFTEIGGDDYYKSPAFRPLITQSQDVALIKSLLTDIREGADI